MNTTPTDQLYQDRPASLAEERRVERGLRKRLAAVLGLITFAFLVVTLTSIYVLYQTAFQEERTMIAELARSQALVIDAMADFDSRESRDVPGGAFEATLSQVRSAFLKLQSSDRGRELLLGRIEGDEIEYLVRQGHEHDKSPWRDPLESGVSEPMRRALTGLSGTMTGLDRDGRPVLAAYEPIPKLGAGLVARISLTDLREPFLRAAGTALGCTLAFTLGCVWLLHRMGTPLVRAAEQSYLDAARTNQALRATILEQEQTEKALRASESRFREFLENLGDAAFMLDTSGCIVYVNSWAEKLVGRDVDSIVGQSFEPLVSRDTLPKAQQAFADVIRGDTADLEVTMVTGKIVHARMEPHYDSDRRIVGAVGIARDVSERNELIRALRESEARFRAMTDDSPVGVYMADAAGNNVYVNRAICQFTGLRPDDHAGQGWRKSIHPDDREAMARTWLHAAEHHQPFEHEFRFRATDGRVTWVLSRAVPLRNESGEITGFIGTTTDVTAQKRAEQVLRESEQFIRSALHALSSHLAVIDESGRIVAVNEAWRQFAMQNQSSDAAVGEGANYLQVCDTAQGDDAMDARTVARGIREVLSGTRLLFEHEYTCNSPTEERWFVVRVTRFMSDGSPRAVIAHENITARKRAEHSLLEQKQLLALVLSSIPHNVFWKDTNSVYLGCNDQFARAAGLGSHEEIVGKTDYDLAWTREEADWYRKCDAEVMASGKPLLDIEETQRAPDGTNLTILTSKVPLRSASGQITGLLGVFIDISDRKRTEQRLRLQSAALAAAANAIVITDRTGSIVWTNPAFTELTGYTAEEALGASPRLLKSGQYPPEFYRQMWSTILSGRVWQGELTNRRKNGELYTEEMTITPVRTVDNGITHFVAIKRDISERKRHEEERLRLTRIERESGALLRAKRAADAANQAKSDFLANMSHELRTPLNGVITLNELLLKTELQPTQRRFAYLAKKSGETLLSLINDILDFSKIEAGKLELEVLDFTLSDVVDQASATVAAAADAKGLELVCSLHPAVPRFLRGDPTRLKQVLTNLMNNAVKFTEQGEVHLRVMVDRIWEDRTSLRFSVTDTGIGIAMDRQALLFQKFTQADSSTTRKYGGTGLGLAICKRIVEAMGGDIGVNSSLGAGSTFWFTAAFRKQANAGQRPLAAPADLRHLKILVVDDNALNREVLQEQLSYFGLSARAVSDGPAALDELRAAATANDPFNLAILDYQMPGMDGTELAERIKSEAVVADTVLILLSSSGDYDPIRFRKLGFAGWVTKPVSSAELLGAIVEGYACAQTRQADPMSEAAPASAQSDTGQVQAGKAHLLLVEDNEIGQEAARELLRRYGYTCDIAANGRVAVDAVLKGQFDLVLMDCQMPEMDGFEATRIIRQIELEGKLPGRHGQRLPIIALTANALSGDREKCLAAGMDDYLSKPLNPSGFMEVISRHLGRSTSTQETEPMDRITDGAPTGNAAIDFAALNERWGGNVTFAQTLLDRFCRDIPPMIDQLAEKIERGNFEEAARVAHSIKGAAGYVEAGCVRLPAAELEQFCRDSQADQAGKSLSQLRGEIERCVASIRQHQPEVGAGRPAARESEA